MIKANQISRQHKSLIYINVLHEEIVQLIIVLHFSHMFLKVLSLY